jgi:hypothetical protein
MRMAVMYDTLRINISLPYRGRMELKTARLTLLIDPNKKSAFERLCAQRDLTASQVVRQLIRDYLAEHGVDYVPSGQADAVEGPAASAAARAGKSAPPVKQVAPKSARPARARHGR